MKYTKGYMEKKLKSVGIYRINDKKFHQVKTAEVIKMYYDVFGGFTN